MNLERALRADSRLGGHFVTGHIEGIGKLKSINNLDNSIVFDFSVDPSLSRYIVKKGSIAVDGFSLTVAGCSGDGFSAAVIPFTLKNTNLGSIKIGGTVNIETDIMAKYAEKAVSSASGKKLTMDFLKDNGYI